MEINCRHLLVMYVLGILIFTSMTFLAGMSGLFVTFVLFLFCFLALAVPLAYYFSQNPCNEACAAAISLLYGATLPVLCAFFYFPSIPVWLIPLVAILAAAIGLPIRFLVEKFRSGKAGAFKLLFASSSVILLLCLAYILFITSENCSSHTYDGNCPNMWDDDYCPSGQGSEFGLSGQLGESCNISKTFNLSFAALFLLLAISSGILYSRSRKKKRKK
ncbi:hypothetical protein JW721_03060 [Candidatus Micrarchaeota archaeon]|nr:hypothetical protein [Candidatus Micrarchaeota archaeon]